MIFILVFSVLLTDQEVPNLPLFVIVNDRQQPKFYDKSLAQNTIHIWLQNCSFEAESANESRPKLILQIFEVEKGFSLALSSANCCRKPWRDLAFTNKL